MRNKNLIDIFLSLLIFVFVGMQLASCAPANLTAIPTASATAPSTSEPAEAIGPRLRIKNDSDQEIKNLIVLFPDSRISFGTVAANATTEYQIAPKGVYNFAAYEYEIDGQVVTQRVRDFVGESPRAEESFTYVIAFDPSSTTMPAIELKEVLVP